MKKNIAIVVLFLAAATFAGLYLNQTARFIQSQTAVESLQQQVGELQSTVEVQEKKSVALRSEIQQAQSETATRDREIAQLKASANPAQLAAAVSATSPRQAPAAASNPLASIAKMFEDPEMKDALAAQQKAALGPFIDKTYARLFSTLQLTPEQAAALKEMLLNKQMLGAEMGLSMLSDTADASKRAQAGQQLTAATEAADAEIKAFLGEEKFAQLKAYEKTTADRMVVSGFKDQLGSAAALTPEQEDQLIDVMTQTRQNFKFSTDFMDKGKTPGDFSAVFNEENVNRFMQETDQLNQNFLSHAQNILTPDQLESFRKHLNNQQALQKVGMQMGAKMLAQPKQEAPAQ